MRHVEDALQSSVVDYLRFVAPDCVTFAVPNGGKRNKREAGRLKAAGVLAGVPDLVVVAPGQVIFMELKAPKEYAKKHQIEIHERLRAFGHTVAIVRSIDDARNTLRACGVRLRETETPQRRQA